jgi:DNA-binding PucR family transcriptional regulator
VLPAGQGLLRADDHLPTLVLHADAALARDLVARELAPLDALPAGSRAKLAATLRVWLDHRGRVEETAHLLGVHPQTVRYRVNQLRELFGARLEDPEGRHALALALRADGYGAD